MQTNPTDDATEVTILRGKVAELERQLWQARHDYGQALQQNARHATTIAMMRKAQARTAEDERHDVLAFIGTELAKQEAGLKAFMNSDFTNAAARCVARAESLRTVRAYINRGDHVGAADREAVKP